MTQRFQVPKLLNTSRQGPHFLDRLQVSTEEQHDLRRIRATVRQTLRQGFESLRSKAKNNPTLDIDVSSLVPKFKTQGSFEYGTLNNPATCPPQQIDLDDGVYFPMDFVEEQPRVAQNILCNLVDGMLKSLAENNGWKFETKPTCARLQVSNRIHVDVPVYAIPESKSAALEKAAKLETNRSITDFSMDQKREQFLRLDPNEVYLALRTNDAWIQSDPMKVLDWFATEQNIHDSDTKAKNNGRLTRVCRYLKAWRDNNWQEGGPSSITLMAVTVEVFNKHLNDTGEHFKSDCEALLAVVREMPQKFSGNIMNPADPNEPKLFPRNLTHIEIQKVHEKIDKLKTTISSALCTAETKDECVSLFISVLGDRFPNRPNEVELMPIAAVVRSTLADSQPQPTANRTFRSA